MSFDAGPRKLRTASELKAVAHPLRLAIMEALTVHGEMTASEVGERLDETPANCSWHLRKLAEHGLVEETHDGRGRRRPWRAVTVGFSWDSTAPEPGATVAGTALRDELVRREVERFDRNHSRDQNWQISSATQGAFWMTKAEAEQLSEHLVEIALSHRERLGDADERPDDARLVWMLSLLSVEPE